MNPEELDRMKDDLIDEALARHARVEPRPGLERRILASLEVRRAAPQKPRWLWMLAPAALIALILASVLFIYKPHAPAPVKHAAQSHSAASTSGTIARRPGPRAVTRGSVPVARRVSTPRLPQFPSLAPLSEQEQMLIRFFNEHRDEAVLFAKTQHQPLENLRIKEIKIAPLAEDSKLNSDEEE